MWVRDEENLDRNSGDKNLDRNSGDIYGDKNVDLEFEVVGKPCHGDEVESDPNGVSIPMQDLIGENVQSNTSPQNLFEEK